MKMEVDFEGNENPAEDSPLEAKHKEDGEGLDSTTKARIAWTHLKLLFVFINVEQRAEIIHSIAFFDGIAYFRGICKIFRKHNLLLDEDIENIMNCLRNQDSRTELIKILSRNGDKR